MSIYVKIKKHFKDFTLDVNFYSAKGITGLLGASGAGKSITLKCIAGIITPEEGEIILNKRILFDSKSRINLPPQKRQIGYLFQNYALFPNMTVEQNIACGLCHEKNKKIKNKKIAEIIQKMKLSGLEKKLPAKLSGGQQQRTALARILAGQPQLILLDEPLSALDAYLRDKVLTEMKAILETFNKDSLIVTHDKNEAYALCKQLVIVDKGSVIDTGDTKKVFSFPNSRVSAILTGCKNIVKAKKINNNIIEVPSWGIKFSTENDVLDNLSAIGIRSHYFDPEEKLNSFKISVIEKIEEPFEWIIKFKYSLQNDKSEALWWSFSKKDRFLKNPEKLGISPKDILLLYS